MIRLQDRLYVGDSSVSARELRRYGIGALLNVAHDLKGDMGWPDIEYMQVGLIDGPGNSQAAYAAAVLALNTLVAKHNTVVFCHSGGRAMAVATMHMNLGADRNWDELAEIANERIGTNVKIPEVNEAHRAAFDKMKWNVLRKLVNS